MSSDPNINIGLDDHVSIIGASFFHGIAALCQFLLQCADRDSIARSDESMPRHYENAYCISICVLAIAAVESAETRIRFLEEGLEYSAPNGQFTWLCKEYPTKKIIADELAFVRGSILHNHLYKIEQGWVSDKRIISNIQKRAASGDGKFDKFVDPTTYKTKALDINVIPSQIRFLDVIHVLDAVSDLLSVLNDRSKEQLGFMSVSIALGNERGLKLGDLILRLKKRLETYQADHETSNDSDN